ncbi:MAG: hypothetical protein GY722_22805, partial [bacterium]|nr:hypothetical protein [bacterium]
MSLSRALGAALVCLLAFPAATRADGPECGADPACFEGLPFDPESFHEVEVAVNPGNANEVRSAREPLALAQRLLTDYGPRRPWLGGARSLLVS